MIIYKVKTGDSLFTVSEKFGVSSLDIKLVNGLGTHPYLVKGQSLLIPAKPRPRALSENTDEIIRIAGKKYRQQIIVAACAELDLFSVGTLLEESKKTLSLLSPLKYIIREDCTLRPLGQEAVLGQLKENNAGILLNIEYGRVAANFDESMEWRLIKSILNILKAYGFGGLQIECTVNSADLPGFVRFIRKLKKAVNPLAIPVFALLEPSSWLGTNSYATIGNIADYVVLKLYNLFINTKSVCPLAPADIAQEILSATVEIIPAKKLIIKLPVYGWDWNAKSRKYSMVSTTNAITFAARRGSDIEYDPKSQSPFIKYSDEFGNRHVIWFEDICSLYNKLELVNSYKLAGICFDLIEYDTFSLWHLLRYMFNIRARVL
ncbi:MAG TPA: LysM peptidoglycan-binding domain-containing protein [Clostridiales bacterium]|nr:LysM peptidoglycan-binding domain-containing protein [Clostridiales bacterium]